MLCQLSMKHLNPPTSSEGKGEKFLKVLWNSCNYKTDREEFWNYLAKICRRLYPHWWQSVKCNEYLMYAQPVVSIDDDNESVNVCVKLLKTDQENNEGNFREIENDLLHEPLKEKVEECELGCPYIKAKVNNWEGKGLIDTGSPISPISEKFRNKIRDGVDFVEALVMGVKIRGATGKHSKVIKSQVFLSFEIEDVKFEQGCLVIPSLKENILFGMDWVLKVSAAFSWSEMKSNVCEPKSNIIVCTQLFITHCGEGCNHVRKIIDYEENLCCYDNKPELNFSGQNYENLVRSKVEEAINLDSDQKRQLENLSWEFQDVFNEKPGRVRFYQCTLHLKNHEPFFLKPYSIPFAK
ncbi:uncharacterized protein LOC124789832 [Schistocerca piceifrons]|uniref:uncharacterized protein LOC124789832 n=1 Tax=Schistocerca piceifrons TaxID=274613 RepID=UPI001F5F1DB9|nr:uncharacterized protein LOC124789832 [Schistocerca piceifrons]